MQLKLDQLSSQFRGKQWRKLQYTEELVHYMASSKQVQYQKFKRSSSESSSASSSSSSSSSSSEKRNLFKIFAKYGARNVDAGGPVQRLKGKIHRFYQRYSKRTEVALVRMDPETKGVVVLESCEWKEPAARGAAEEEAEGAEGGAAAGSGTAKKKKKKKKESTAEKDVREAAEEAVYDATADASLCTLRWKGQLE